MEQVKCGEVYRDLDGNFNYVCNCCSYEFLSAPDFEQHIAIHASLNGPLLKDETLSIDNPHSPEQNYSIQIEPVSLNADKAMMMNMNELGDEDDEEEYEDDGDGSGDGGGGILIVRDGIDADDYDDVDEDDDDMDKEIEFKETEFIIDSESMSQDVLISISDESMFKCDCCDKTYACRGLRQQHLLKFMEEDKMCKLCPAYYEKEAELNAHKKVHNLANTMPCPHCLEVFASVNKLKRHLTSSKTELGLTAAGTRARKPVLKKRRRQIDDDDDVDFDYEQKTSSADAGGDDDYEVEGDKRHQKFTCKICGKEYSYMHYLKKHLKRHSDDTLNHKCEICNHVFKLRQNLTAHMRVHTGGKH